MWVRSLGREDPLKEGWQPTPVFLENPMDRRAWQATVYWVTKSQTCTAIVCTVIDRFGKKILEYFWNY